MSERIKPNDHANVNKAIVVPEKLVAHPSGVIYHVAEWNPEVSHLDGRVAVRCELIPYHPEKMKIT